MTLILTNWRAGAVFCRKRLREQACESFCQTNDRRGPDTLASGIDNRFLPLVTSLEIIGTDHAEIRARRICEHCYDTRQQVNTSSRWEIGRQLLRMLTISGLSPGH